MKFIDSCPFADPDAAARKLVELANAVEPGCRTADLVSANVASLLCQRIDVADDVRDSPGSPSVTVAAVSRS